MPRKSGSILALGTVAAAISLIALACSSTPNPDPAVTGSSGGEGGVVVAGEAGGGDSGDQDAGLVFNPPDAADGAVTCPVPAFGAPSVNAQFVAGSPPTDTGGVLTPGTYDLTGLELYEQTSMEDDGGVDAGVATDHARGTFVLTSDMIQLSRTASPPGGGTDVVTMFVAMQHVSDIFLVTERTCPDTGMSQIPFTSTATTITLHALQTRREIYTRRP